jgi:hypothetical protein
MPVHLQSLQQCSSEYDKSMHQALLFDHEDDQQVYHWECTRILVGVHGYAERCIHIAEQDFYGAGELGCQLHSKTAQVSCNCSHTSA